MRWPKTRVTERLGLRYPLVQAPLAGSTPPALVAAVCEAGALGSLGAARMAPDALRRAIVEIRALTSRPFAVNLFAPLAAQGADERAIARVRATLDAYRTAPAPAVAPAPPPPIDVADQLEVVAAERVAAFSFTFGIPELETIRASGAALLGTATTVAEALALESAGVDAVVLQGFEAGGHRGTFLGELERAQVGLMALVPQAADAVSVPLIAAGGIMDGRGVAAALTLGAEAAQLGTAFLACPESGADERWRAALAGARDDATLLTAAATGRLARMVPSAAVEALIALDEPGVPFPLQASLLGEIAAPAWLAGQASGMARALPAAELVAALVTEAEAALARKGCAASGGHQ